MIRDVEFDDVDHFGVPILTSLQPASDADVIRDLSHQLKIDRLYHWSPARAIGSIARHGLLSGQQLQYRDIRYVGHGYGSLEKERELSKFVCVSFRRKERMMGQWSDAPVVWILDPEILTGQWVLFVPSNAARADVSLADVKRASGARAYESCLTAIDSTLQPEAYIPIRVTRRAITGAEVSTDQLANEVVSAFQTVGIELPDGVHRTDRAP